MLKPLSVAESELGGIWFLIHDGEDRHVAEVYTEADAARIARVYNAHDDLLAALRLAQYEMRHAPACAANIDRGDFVCSCEYMRAYNLITMVAAKAEGK